MYIEQAFKHQHEWWRYLVGFIIIFLVGWQFIGVMPIGIVSFLKAGNLEVFMEASLSNFSSLYPSKSNLYLWLILMTFCGGFIALWFTIKFIHRQSMRSLITSRKKVDWGRFFFGFSLIAVTTVVLTLIDYNQNPEHYELQFEMVPFLIMAGIAIIFVPIQTSFEELLFRGYLMQGFGVILKSKWLPLIITSVIFGGLHALNPEVDKLGNVIMIFYIGTGLFLGIITLMDDGLELALGFHAGNNLVAALLVTADWTAFQTHSILLDVSDPSTGLTVIAPVFIVYPIFLGIMAWKYKWKNWGNKLFGPVTRPAEEIIVIDETNL